MDRNPQGEKKDLFRLLLVAGAIALLILSVRGILGTRTATIPATSGATAGAPAALLPSPTSPTAVPTRNVPEPSLLPSWPPSLSPTERTSQGGSPTGEALPQAAGRLAFVAVRDRYPALYVIDAGGTGLVQLSDEMGFLSAPSWSPDGTRLVFWAIQDVNVDAGEADLYVVNVDGSGFANLTRSPAGELSPDWSPDGGSAQQIVFVSTQPGKEELFIINADGTGLRQLTNDPQTFARDPRWSPNGGSAQLIAFTCADSLETFVCLIRPDGTGLARLTPGESPRWSPDGRRLAFFGRGNGGSQDIFLMNFDGSGLANLTNSSAVESGLAWSPDGAWIVFGSSQGEEAGLARICVACGGEAQGIQELAEPGRLCSDPVWSPGGRTLACLADGALSIMNADGSGLTRLAEDVLPKSYAWGP